MPVCHKLYTDTEEMHNEWTHKHTTRHWKMLKLKPNTCLYIDCLLEHAGYKHKNKRKLMNCESIECEERLVN